MKQLDINMLVGTMAADITKLVQATIDAMDSDFTTETTDNAKAGDQADLYNAMNQYIVYTMLNSTYKKAFDSTKKNLDHFSEVLGLDIEGSPEITKTIAEVNGITFKKKQNKDGTSTLVTDLLNALNRLGVEKSVLDDAVNKATKPKRGNTYYQIEAID